METGAAPKVRGGRWRAAGPLGGPSGLPPPSTAASLAAAGGSCASRPARPQRRLLFVGNSLTYQPKELGGLPGAVARIASGLLGEDWECEAVTQGGADLLELWEEFEARLLRSVSCGETFDTVVLQVGRCSLDPGSRFASTEALGQRYGPLLRQCCPRCQVVLYQTWAEPGDAHVEDALRDGVLEGYRASLVSDADVDLALQVLIASVGKAFRLVQERADLGVPDLDASRLYPALFKDDSGHPSALAGAATAWADLVGHLASQLAYCQQRLRWRGGTWPARLARRQADAARGTAGRR